jgi:type III secretion system low calcium response chaperone LcrH/SycD
MERFEEMHNDLQKMLEKIVQQLRELSPPEFQVTPAEPLLDSDVHTMGKNLLSIYHKMERGMRKLVELLNELSTVDTITKDPQITIAVGDMITIASVVMQQVKPALHLMAKGEPLQDILGISALSLQSLYKLSRYLYEHQHYEEASGAFYLLSLINPSYHIFWIGLGNCEYFLQRYQEALLAYTFAMQTTPSDSSCHLLIARCQMALGNYAAATATLSIAELSCTDHESSEKIKRQADEIRKDLKRYLP